MDKATISVVISTYNAAETLQACLTSYAEQTYPAKELIIIDGASNDATMAIVESFNQHVTHFISEPDTGIYNAWNKALKLISGAWVYFLGADDYFKDPSVLQKAAEFLDAVPAGVNVAYGRVDYINVNGAYLYTRGEPWEKVGRRYRQLMTIPHQGVFHKSTLFEIHGIFDETFVIAGDFELLLRELKDHTAVFMPITLANMTQAGISARSENSLRIMREIRRAQRKNGIHYAGFHWYFALIRVYVRLILWRLLGEKVSRCLLDIGRWLMGKPAHWTKNISK